MAVTEITFFSGFLPIILELEEVTSFRDASMTLRSLSVAVISFLVVSCARLRDKEDRFRRARPKHLLGRGILILPFIVYCHNLFCADDIFSTCRSPRPSVATLLQ